MGIIAFRMSLHRTYLRHNNTDPGRILPLEPGKPMLIASDIVRERINIVHLPLGRYTPVQTILRQRLHFPLDFASHHVDPAFDEGQGAEVAALIGVIFVLLMDTEADQSQDG